MYYKITLTTSGGFIQSQIQEFKKLFDQQTHAYIAVEYGEHGGNCHLEGVVERPTQQTNNVTVWLKGQYAKQDIYIHHNSIRVKKCTHLIGALVYASKELTKNRDSKIISLRGWESSWIDKQMKLNVSKIAHLELKKRGTRVTQNTGGALMYEWCIAHNMHINCTLDCTMVVKLMAKQGYLFGSIKPVGLYVDVSSLFGGGEAAEMFFTNQLHFM